MKLIFLPEAEVEIDEAVGLLDAVSSNLGDDFYGEVDSVIERILSFPNIGKTVVKKHPAVLAEALSLSRNLPGHVW